MNSIVRALLAGTARCTYLLCLLHVNVVPDVRRTTKTKHGVLDIRGTQERRSPGRPEDARDDGILLYSEPRSLWIRLVFAIANSGITSLVLQSELWSYTALLSDHFDSLEN